jgi:hypothetical protein
MPLVPEFEIGLWNAWILTLYFILHPLIMMLIDKLVGTGDIFKKMGAPAYNKTESVINIFDTILFFGLFIYSIFLPVLCRPRSVCIRGGYLDDSYSEYCRYPAR